MAVEQGVLLAARADGILVAPDHERGRVNRAGGRRTRAGRPASCAHTRAGSLQLSPTIASRKSGGTPSPTTLSANSRANAASTGSVSVAIVSRKLQHRRVVGREAVEAADDHHSKGPLGTIDRETPRDVAGARRADQHRRLEANRVHEGAHVGHKVVRPVAVVGRSESPWPRWLGAKAWIESGRRAQQQLERAPGVRVACRSTTGTPEGSPCSTYRRVTPVDRTAALSEAVTHSTMRG